MHRLLKKLYEWQQQGLLNPAQVENIFQYETQKTSINWPVLGFVLIGIMACGIGLVAIVAANWHEIPDAIKLLSVFAALLVNASFIFYLASKNFVITWEALLLLMLLLCIATIALIGQIYNTNGTWYQALFYCAIITAPLAFYARSQVLPLAWCGIFLISGIFMGIDLDWWNPNHYIIAWLSPVMLAPLLAAIFYRLLLFCHAPIMGHAFKYWIVISGLVALALADILLSSGFWYTSTMTYFPSLSFIGNYGLATVICAYLLISHSIPLLRKLLLLGITLCYSLFLLFILTLHESELLAAINAIAILILASCYYGNTQQRAMFILFTLLIVTRLLIVYFTVIGSLAYTGLGLIISGIIMIICAMLWVKLIKHHHLSVRRSAT